MLAQGARVKDRFPQDIRNLAINTWAPMLVNYQVSFRVARGETCWRLQDAVRQALFEVPEIVGGRQAYSVVDQSLSARRKNATIAKARSALLQVAPRADHIRADFHAGVIYWSPRPSSDEGFLPLGKMINGHGRLNASVGRSRISISRLSFPPRRRPWPNRGALVLEFVINYLITFALLPGTLIALDGLNFLFSWLPSTGSHLLVYSVFRSFAATRMISTGNCFFLFPKLFKKMLPLCQARIP